MFRLTIKRSLKDNINSWVLLAPWLVTFIVFWAYPLCYSFYLSLSKYSTLTNVTTFIGFDNYSRILSYPVFWTALLNTLIFTTGTVPVTTALALLFASLINSRMVRFKDFFRSSYFLPSVTSLVVISLIFTNLYSQQGYVNTLLAMLGLPHPAMGWLAEPSTALFSIMAMDVWISAGYYTVLFLAAMQTVPSDLYDAARISGASPWMQFRRITLPMIRSTLLFVIVINTIKSFQIFIEIYIMTRGGPMGSTTTLVYMVFVNAFEKADMMGFAAALAYVVFIILLAFSLVQMRLLREKN